MTNKKNNKKELPDLKTDQDVDEFWSAHDFSDYAEAQNIVHEKVELSRELVKTIRERSKKKHLVAIRLSDEQYVYAQKLAFSRSLGLSTLIRAWIAEAISRESQFVHPVA